MTVPRLPSVICPFPGDPIGAQTVLTPFIRPSSEGGFAEKRVAFHRLSLPPSPPFSDMRPSVRRPFHPSVLLP